MLENSAEAAAALWRTHFEGRLPRASESVPIPQAMASEMPAPPVRAGGDWLFIAAMVAMLAVLGVLIYLILTLE